MWRVSTRRPGIRFPSPLRARIWRQEEEFDLAAATAGFLMGDFTGTIPTPGTRRHPERIRLALVRQGDRITGQATVVGREEERQRQYELSSWIELRKLETRTSDVVADWLTSIR